MPAPLSTAPSLPALLRGLGAVAMLLALGACTAPPPDAATARANAAVLDLPDLTALPRAVPASTASNADVAAAFMELSFALESGRSLPVFTRFEGPVRLRLTGAVPAAAPQETAGLLALLRSRAGIDITQSAEASAEITVAFVPREQMQALVPNAACFVVPNVAGWDDYRRARGSAATEWARLTTRRRAAVFIPADIAPQEVRDCLHEEVAQALGPLNDLYRLPDSVFNDANFHSVLTSFDLLVLRAYYAPELRSGMTPDTVAERLPALLSRLNPTGGDAGGWRAAPATPRAFAAALDRALGGGRLDTPAQRASARQAVAIAQAAGWSDARAAFAWFALGRLSVGADPQGARAALLQARALYAALPGAGVQLAHVDMQLAGLALASAQPVAALALSRNALPPAIASENAALAATLLLIAAEAQQALGDTGAAQAARLDSARWAGYGFGSQAAADQRAAEVAALARAATRLR
jgi:hypothetical protein